MVVYPLPPQLSPNPYLDQLYGPLEGLGVMVWRTRPRYALPALLAGRGERLLHLHFFDELTQQPGRWATAARTLLFVALLAALRGRGVRLVWTAHNLEPHELRHPAWAFLAYRYVVRQADAVIAHSASALEQLRARYGSPRRAAIIPHGSYVGLYGPPRPRADGRAALKLPAHGRLVLSLGTLRPYKGLEDLIDAFAQLPRETRGTLLIAGAPKDGAYADELARRAAQVAGARVEPRFIPDADLPLYLAAANVVALPYRSLLTSGMLLGALSYARPVVAPAFGPVCELVREGREGFLFTPGSVPSLRDALARALAHPDLDALGAAGLRAAGELAWPKIAARTAVLYREVTAEAAR
ncbi:MAG TPA: glycosyltransferase family 4 protein [Roseiflexaceae bacterium]|nr:glycosyltransferase family 4 protein [Roseiflexaceae bacterium]